MAEGIIIRRGIAPAEVIEYIAATGGTTEEYNESGKRYKSHTFTSSGNFVVNSLGTGELNAVDYLIIAGGGGHGARQYAGGGGAGGYRTTVGTSGRNSAAENKINVTTQSYTITVGAGGVSSTLSSNTNSGATNGANSSALGITSLGGGIGAAYQQNAGNGGSGGGLGGRDFGSYSQGLGTANQGFDGGISPLLNSLIGSGGGGAGENGVNGTSSGGGKGGDGLPSIIRNGSTEYRGGGGGGGRGDTSLGVYGQGGLGGGGNGNNTGSLANGQPNTGGGAGATNTGQQALGGSGIVIIRYEIAPSA